MIIPIAGLQCFDNVRPIVGSRSFQSVRQKHGSFVGEEQFVSEEQPAFLYFFAQIQRRLLSRIVPMIAIHYIARGFRKFLEEFVT
ncbi:hypothetical protein MnTg04_01468 [bacterium MnTg04]|nr:hypothetical protein MnTg04_01468 [bacterium MnTg04]